MAASNVPSRLEGVERVRAEFLTAIHFGQLKPGDRVPSVRRLAQQIGLNRKTIHRAYRILAREGLLELRPGSGTFLTEQVGTGGPTVGALLVALNRCRVEAGSLGVDPGHFARVAEIYFSGALRETMLLVVECNMEQIGLIERELRLALGVMTRGLQLDRFLRVGRPAARGCTAIVTTECHRKEVREALGAGGPPVYAVWLDPEFPQTLVEWAASGPVWMIVRDGGYESAFRRMLRQMHVQPQILDRIRMMEPGDLPRDWSHPKSGAAAVSGIYVSPLVAGEVAGRIPPALRRIEIRRHLSLTSLERLRALLAFDAARTQGRWAAGPADLVGTL